MNYHKTPKVKQHWVNDGYKLVLNNLPQFFFQPQMKSFPIDPHKICVYLALIILDLGLFCIFTNSMTMLSSVPSLYIPH